EGARDLQHALLPIRKARCTFLRARTEADEIQELARLGVEAAGAPAHQVLPERRVLVDMEAGTHVLEQRELLEESDLLEGARNAEARALVSGHAAQLAAAPLQ